MIWAASGAASVDLVENRMNKSKKQNLARQAAHMDLEQVEALRRQRQTRKLVHPNGATPPRRKWQGMGQAAWPHMLCFRNLSQDRTYAATS